MSVTWVTFTWRVCASGTCCEMTEPSLKKAVFIFRHVTSIEKDKKLRVPIREVNL